MFIRSIILFLLLISHVWAVEKILNVSYDPTRKLYEEMNSLFEADYQRKNNKEVKVLQSHGGSAKQARSVIEGMPADVVSLATEYDIDQIVKKGFIKETWREIFPNNSAPFASTIVFLVKKGNPKSIFDWQDLVREDVKVIMPNPKTSGVAKLEYLAVWSYAIEKYKSKEAAYDFIKKLFKNTPVLDSGSRGASVSFVNRNLGDVLITWENEAYLALKENGNDKFEIVIPPISLNVNLPVTLVDKVVTRRKSENLVREYISFLYTKEAQEIAANNYFRPIDPKVLSKYENIFSEVKSFDLNRLGNLNDFYNIHFGKNGIFDQIFEEATNKP